MSRIIIFGATSAIAEQAARRWAAEASQLVLAGRDQGRLEAIAQDLRVRGARSVAVLAADLRDLSSHEGLVAQSVSLAGGLDVALVAHGLLASNEPRLSDRVAQMLETNAVSAISLLEHLAVHVELQRSGTLVVISSVAGDRGRANNALYGAAKAAVTAHASALRQRLRRCGGWVVTVKPGFVDTPMTAGFAKGPLWASAASVGAGIVHAVRRRRAEVYLPGFWRWVMLGIKALPEAVFLRMRF